MAKFRGCKGSLLRHSLLRILLMISHAITLSCFFSVNNSTMVVYGYIHRRWWRLLRIMVLMGRCGGTSSGGTKSRYCDWYDAMRLLHIAATRESHIATCRNPCTVLGKSILRFIRMRNLITKLRLILLGAFGSIDHNLSGTFTTTLLACFCSSVTVGLKWWTQLV
jgi:hypothetical protein